MNIAKQLDALNAKRKALVAQLEALTDKSEEESRTFTPDEQKSFDANRAEIDSVDAQVKRLEDMQRIVATTAQPAGEEDDEPKSPVVKATRIGNGAVPTIRMAERPRGQVFTRYVMALTAAKGNLMQAVEIAKNWRDTTPEVETILKAAVSAGTTTDTTFAKELIEYTTASAEFIELLRPETLVGRIAGFRAVPFLTRVQRQLTGASAGWVGEGKPKPMSELSFDAITIPHAKVAVIVALTDELVRFSNPAAESMVRQDLVAAVSQYLDEQFTDPTVTVSAGVRPASITNGADSDASNGTSLDQVTLDLTTAMGALITGNVPVRSRYWIMNPRTELYLRTLRNTQGLYAFKDEMTGGRLMGFPVLTSNAIGIASGDTNIILLEASEIFLADDGEVMVDASREASLQFDSAPSDGAQSLVSLWQNNLVGLRAERFIYWLRRRDAAVHVTTGVAY